MEGPPPFQLLSSVQSGLMMLRLKIELVDVWIWPILLQKSVAADGPSAISLREAGFDLPALTLSAQLQRYAMHRA